MKKIFLLLWFMPLCSVLCHAKDGANKMASIAICDSDNMVPNCSFEDTVQCPHQASQILLAKFWTAPTKGSPDYYNSCDVGDVGVPINVFGNMPARTGNAYAGVVLFVPQVGNYREYVQVKLRDSLKNGKKYDVELYVSNATNCINACSNIGVLLTDYPVSSANSYVLQDTPQVNNNPVNNPLTAQQTWLKVSGSFIAMGGEVYLTIGNFNDDATSDVFIIDSTRSKSSAYLYIDDVSLIEDTSYKGNGIPPVAGSDFISIYPNPANDELVVDYHSKTQVGTIELYSVVGEKVLTYALKPNERTTINTTSLNAGVYLWRLKEKEQTTGNGRIVIMR